jgi:hypothetical protein
MSGPRGWEELGTHERKARAIVVVVDADRQFGTPPA